MQDKELRRGIRNAWILVFALVALVIGWTAYAYTTNVDEVPAAHAPGAREFVPASSPYGVGYRTPQLEPQQR